MSKRRGIARRLASVMGLLLVLGCYAAADAATHRFPDMDPVQKLFESDSLLTAFRATLSPGDTVLVPPGRRPMSREFPAGITWMGDGPVDSVVFTGFIPSSPVFYFSPGPDTTRVEGMTFDLTEFPDATALYFRTGNLYVRNNTFLGGYAIHADSCGGLVRGNRFAEPSSAVRCEMSTFWVDQNEIVGARNAAISLRGSALRITRNRIIGNVNTGIVIVGKRFVPVIGGEPGMGNELRDGMNSVVYNHSGKVVNAQYNYWGIATTEEMSTLGYPANIAAITDGWEEEKDAGKVDYRNWLDAPNGKPVKPTNLVARYRVPIASGAVIAIIVAAAARRRRSRRATA